MDNNSVVLVGRPCGERTARKKDRNEIREKTLKDEAEKKKAAAAGAKARRILTGATSAVTFNAVVNDKLNGTIGAGAGGPIVSRSSGTIVQFGTPPTFDWSRPTTSSTVVKFSFVSGYQRTDQVDNIDDLDREDPLCATDYVQEMVSILHVALLVTCILVSFSSAHLTNRAPPSLSS